MTGADPHWFVPAGVASTMAVLLAIIFLAAATTKASNPSATATEFRQLGLPASGLLARLVPPVELMTGLALLTAPRVGAELAIALLLIFTAIIVATVRSGRRVSCGCLGALSSQPVSILTIARNVGLLAMALMASTTTTLTVPDGPSAMAAISAVLLVVLAFQLVGLRRDIGRIWSVELAGEGGRTSNPSTPDRKGIPA